MEVREDGGLLAFAAPFGHLVLIDDQRWWKSFVWCIAVGAFVCRSAGCGTVVLGTTRGQLVAGSLRTLSSSKPPDKEDDAMAGLFGRWRRPSLLQSDFLLPYVG